MAAPPGPAYELTDGAGGTIPALDAMLAVHRYAGRRVILRLTEAQTFVRRVLSLFGPEDIFVVDTASVISGHLDLQHRRS